MGGYQEGGRRRWRLWWRRLRMCRLLWCRCNSNLKPNLKLKLNSNRKPSRKLNL